MTIHKTKITLKAKHFFVSSAAKVHFSIICCHLQIVFSFRSETVMAEQKFEENKKKLVKGEV